MRARDRMTEHALEWALRNVTAGPRLLARPCACGGVVEADPVEPTAGVKEHLRTRRHEAWRAWMES